MILGTCSEGKFMNLESLISELEKLSGLKATKVVNSSPSAGFEYVKCCTLSSSTGFNTHWSKLVSVDGYDWYPLTCVFGNVFPEAHPFNKFCEEQTINLIGRFPEKVGHYDYRRL